MRKVSGISLSCLLVLSLALAAQWFMHLASDAVRDAEDLRPEMQPMILAQTSDGSSRVDRTIGARSDAQGLFLPTQSVANTTAAAAAISVEDAGFMSHEGIAPLHTSWVVLRSMLRPGRAFGGSTITQQLVKNRILKDRRRSLSRKLREAAIAITIEAKYSKQQILAAYLSTVPLGSVDGTAVTGMQAGALVFFHKPIESLSVSESAALAGMIHAPSLYLTEARSGGFAELRARRDFVLNRMIASHAPAERNAIDAALAEPVSIHADHIPEDLRCYMWADQTVRFLIRSTGNGDITSSIVKPLQLAACKSLDGGLAKAKNILPPGAENDVTGSVVVLSGRGELLAIANDSQMEMQSATNARRAICSLAKPFVCIEAAQMGWTGSTVVDVRREIEERHLNWMPRQSGRDCTHAQLSLQDALASSNNCVFTAVGAVVGIDKVAMVLQKSFEEPQQPVPSIAIGSATYASPLEVARAYTVFSDAHPGFRSQLSVEQGDEQPAMPVTDPHNARAVGEMMVGVMKGTAKSLTFPGHPRVKTGSGERDTWFVAVYKDLVVVSWVGSKSGEVPGRWTGAEIAGPIAANIISSGGQFVRERM